MQPEVKKSSDIGLLGIGTKIVDGDLITDLHTLPTCSCRRGYPVILTIFGLEDGIQPKRDDVIVKSSHRFKFFAKGTVVFDSSRCFDMRRHDPNILGEKEESKAKAQRHWNKKEPNKFAFRMKHKE